MEMFKKGFLRVHGIHNINREMSNSEAAARLLQANSPLRLRSIVDGPDTQYKSEVSNGNFVSIVTPNSPYSEGAVMIMAATKESFEKEGLSTNFIYDYPDDVQNEYWKLILASMVATDKTIKAGERNENIVLAVENCISTISTLDHRTSRTLMLPHTQIFKLDSRRIEPGSMRIKSLEHEQAILSRFNLLGRFVNDINQEFLNKISAKNISCKIQEPFGYIINTNIPFDQAMGNFGFIKELMQTHHQSYAKLAQKIISSLNIKNKNRIIPQPSYRIVIYFDKNGKLCIGISPEFLSHVGPLEALGIILERDPSYPKWLNDEELSSYRKTLLKEIIKEKSK